MREQRRFACKSPSLRARPTLVGHPGLSLPPSPSPFLSLSPYSSLIALFPHSLSLSLSQPCSEKLQSESAANSGSLELVYRWWNTLQGNSAVTHGRWCNCEREHCGNRHIRTHTRVRTYTRAHTLACFLPSEALDGQKVEPFGALVCFLPKMSRWEANSRESEGLKAASCQSGKRKKVCFFCWEGLKILTFNPNLFC